MRLFRTRQNLKDFARGHVYALSFTLLVLLSVAWWLYTHPTSFWWWAALPYTILFLVSAYCLAFIISEPQHWLREIAKGSDREADIEKYCKRHKIMLRKQDSKNAMSRSDYAFIYLEDMVAAKLAS